jgi:intron-binding protein aquarius
MANKEDGLPLISKLFPFTSYFSNAPQPIFKGQTFDEDWEIAQVI